jgi:hypothetical protein
VDPSAGRDSSGVADPAKDVLRELVAPGTFKSPQAPVVLADGRILVADYALGLAVVDPRTRRVSWIVHPDSVALSGIDGMVLRGHELYAIQNGVAPERVVRIDLDGAFARVAGLHVIERATARLGEPTHGIIVGNGFYFIANSGWDRFGPDGRMTAQHRGPPAIVRVPLPPPEGG